MHEQISFVVRAKIRKKVLENLLTPRTPTQLSVLIKTHRPTVSRAILSLQKKGLVECLTPNEKMGRLYGLTQQGKMVLSQIKEGENVREYK